MSGALNAAAAASIALGLIAAACALLRTRQVQLALGVLLDFLLAAGLLRLSHDATPHALAAAATIVLVRKIVAFGLDRASLRRAVADDGR